jgi:glycosyltransferase involved in cell wall biosynthesis
MGEGFGMVALEAMERARPVVAAAIGGLGELVRQRETGLLVPAGEADPLAAAIVEVAGDGGLARKMGDAGRRRALSRFLQTFCTDRTELLYEDALGAARRRRIRTRGSPARPSAMHDSQAGS